MCSEVIVRLDFEVIDFMYLENSLCSQFSLNFTLFDVLSAALSSHIGIEWRASIPWS